jgi:SNF2 family DNA or RNA helicase
MITEIEKFGEHKHVLEPMKHQADEFLRTRELKEWAFFWEMGTGKTKPVIDTLAWLFLRQEIDGGLILSDKGSYMNWPDNEIPKHMPKNVPIRIRHWSSQLNTQEQRDLQQILVPQDDLLDLLFMNTEALSTDRGLAFAETFLRCHYGMTVIDEATSIKSPKSARTKSAWKIGKLSEYRRIMTGTPITQGPLDVWAQMEFLKPGCLGFPTFSGFRAYFATIILKEVNGRRFPQIIGYQNLEFLTGLLRSVSSRYLKTDCLDLPDKVYETYYVEHTPEQREYYRRIKEEALIMFDSGQMVSTTNALTAIMKLHQINCGHIKDDDGNTIDIPSNRVSELLNLLHLVNGKAIIWCNFQRDVDLIHKAICDADNLTGYPVDYYGPTPDDQRRENLEAFKNDPDCRWLVGTGATGGKSLTLTEACTTIYFSNNYKLETRLQTEDRNHRYGQRNTVTYIDMVIRNTVDVKILASLKMKKDLAAEVLDGLRDFFL